MYVTYEAGENADQDLGMGSRVVLDMLIIICMLNSQAKMSSELLHMSLYFRREVKVERNTLSNNIGMAKNYLESPSLEELHFRSHAEGKQVSQNPIKENISKWK